MNEISGRTINLATTIADVENVTLMNLVTSKFFFNIWK